MTKKTGPTGFGEPEEDLFDTGAVDTATFDFVGDEVVPQGGHGHGPHMSSLIASTGAVQEIAPGVSLMPIRILGAESRGVEHALMERIQHALASGAHTLVLSLNVRPGYLPSDRIREAVAEEFAPGQGIEGPPGDRESGP